ncbi:hypothetical protein BH20ACI4_BH20ACI4_06390 [soil metagenome]
MNKEAHILAHNKSIFHKSDILSSEICGCFHCLEIFSPSKIEQWVDQNFEDKEETAMCPKCAIDSVIGSASGFPITKHFLSKMRKHWFGHI